MESLPTIRHFRLRCFAGYVRFYLKRNFHGIHLLPNEQVVGLHGTPLLVCLNHPSWWDPLIGLYLSQRLFPDRVHYAPIASAGLAKYGFLEQLGFFGIDPHARAGAERFLRMGESVLSRGDGAFWVTAQGVFTDVRTRPVQLARGVGHLARRCDAFAMLPVALEYAFWNERYPEAFVAVGDPVMVRGGKSLSAHEWTFQFSEALGQTQDALSRLVIGRNPMAFEPLLTGSAGVGGLYDLGRRLKARLSGKPFAAEHGRI